MRFLPTSSCYSWLGRSLHGSFSRMTASYSFLALPACVFWKGHVLCCFSLPMIGHLPTRVACHIDQMHLRWENSRFGRTDGRNSVKLPCKGSLCRQGTAALAHHPQSECKTSLPIKLVCCRRETAASCWLQTACVRCGWQLPPTCRTPPTVRRQ